MTRRLFQRLGVGIAAGALFAASCAGTSAPADVVLEAQWQCDVQRQAFDGIAAMDAELDVRLTEAGLSRADYEDFKQRLADSSALRESVSAEYDAYCLS